MVTVVAIGIVLLMAVTIVGSNGTTEIFFGDGTSTVDIGSLR